jgi:hypothetical protein
MVAMIAAGVSIHRTNLNTQLYRCTNRRNDSCEVDMKKRADVHGLVNGFGGRTPAEPTRFWVHHRVGDFCDVNVYSDLHRSILIDSGNQLEKWPINRLLY